MPKVANGNYPDDLKGIWKDRELYKAFQRFFYRTCPKPALAFLRAGGAETGDKINARSSYKLFDMSGLGENKNPLKLPSNDVSKLKGMLVKGDPMQTDTKKMQKLVKEMHRLVSLRCKTMQIPPFYKSPEFEAYVKANTF